MPRPPPSTPALLEITVRSFAPDLRMAAISVSATPQMPNPPDIRIMPSLMIPAKAASASLYILLIQSPRGLKNTVFALCSPQAKHRPRLAWRSGPGAALRAYRGGDLDQFGIASREALLANTDIVFEAGAQGVSVARQHPFDHLALKA